MMAKNALAELGMNSEAPRKTHESAVTDRIYKVVDNDHDYFVEKDGLRYAGTHLLLELWGARNLGDPEHIDDALCAAAEASGATILHSHFHHFSPNGGVSGVVVLAESHVSIHTWPERHYAAIDVFMCGACDPYKAIPVLRRAFAPASVQLSEHRRGLLP
jgi:S-adenosylmethionine decarboxylase